MVEISSLSYPLVIPLPTFIFILWARSSTRLLDLYINEECPFILYIFYLFWAFFYNIYYLLLFTPCHLSLENLLNKKDKR